VIVERIVVGDFETNCYLVGCQESREAVVIDPGASGSGILRAIHERGLTVSKIINTHGHCDHIGANRLIKDGTGAELLIHRLDAKMLSDPVANLSSLFLSPVVSPGPDRLLEEGDVIEVGTLTFKVLFTPGHTPGSVSILIPERAVFSGDLLFKDSVGRTDFPGSSMAVLVNSICTKLLYLDDSVTVYPGHGEITTIGRERQANPFLARI